MPYIPFFTLCRETAEKETRVITLQQHINEFQLPKGSYAFIEFFCDECDCRRVFLQVLLNDKIVANIAYGWEKTSFYKNEFKGFSEKEIQMLKGPVLDPFLQQSNISQGVMKMFHTMLFTDDNYMNRIKRHYHQFKQALKA